MPQLDIYTYPTQIDFICLFLFLLFLVVSLFMHILHFRSELVERQHLTHLRLEPIRITLGILTRDLTQRSCSYLSYLYVHLFNS